jgi:hypothetical protein
VWGGIGGSIDSQTDLIARLALKLDASRLVVSTVAPVSPAPGDIWVDLN